MAIQLNDHFTYRKLFRAVIPSICMMVFISIYSIVDGLFVSNFVGNTAFAAINFIYPIINFVGAIGFMIGAGGSALVSKTLGEGKKDKANQYFSMFIWLTLILGITVSTILFIFLPNLAILLGAENEMLKNCIEYGRILLVFQTCFIVQNTFQSFFMTAEKPHLGLIISIISGVTNMFLDAVFILVFNMGVKGAAYATGISQTLGAIIPLFYFLKKKDLIINFVKPKFEIKPILKGFGNGLSELVTNISISIVGIVYNFQLLSLAGENGVASYGVILYAQFIFLAVYFGYSMGTASLVGFNYGAKNTKELKNLFKKSIIIIGIAGITLTGLSELLTKPIAMLFVSSNKEVLEMTVYGFRIFALSFIICGFNIYASSFFTALNNGIVSMILSFVRTFVFQIIAILLLPSLFQLDGVWMSVIFSEVLSLGVSILFFILMRRKYQYY